MKANGTVENKKKTRHKRLMWLLPAAALLLVLSLSLQSRNRTGGMETLYASAVTDAVTAEPDEIEPLVELTQSDSLASWDSRGRVLLLSWHSNPERYPQGGEITLSQGAVWTFTDREIAAWYEKNKDGVSDWNLRLEQLIGLPPDAGYTHMSGFWAAPADVIRPAYVPDITGQMRLDFPDGTDPEFQEWFEENRRYSYEESAYPWTRLGYTYDWADNGTEYGLTEFLIDQNATVRVAFTITTEEFIAWLNDGAPTGAANQ